MRLVEELIKLGISSNIPINIDESMLFLAAMNGNLRNFSSIFVERNSESINLFKVETKLFNR